MTTVFKLGNKEVIQEGNKFFTRVFENGEFFESGDFNTLEKAKANLDIIPTIEENNKLIAEFMSIEYKDNYVVIRRDSFSGANPSGKVWQECKYHSDWNWLMPVVEKIDSLCSNRGFEISSRFVHIRVDNNLTISSGVCSNRIEAVYNACVEFIERYNKQKK
jgi:hypothetical protein